MSKKQSGLTMCKLGMTYVVYRQHSLEEISVGINAGVKQNFTYFYVPSCYGLPV